MSEVEGRRSHQNLVELLPVVQHKLESHVLNSVVDAGAKPLDVATVYVRPNHVHGLALLLVSLGQVFELVDTLSEGFHINLRGLRTLGLIDHLHRDPFASCAQRLQLLFVLIGRIYGMLGPQQSGT